MEEKKLMLDLLVSLFILLFIFGPRFNTWGSGESENMFSGKPSEYISQSRYIYFCCIYLFTFVVLAIVLNNFPELLNFLPEFESGDEISRSLKNIFGDGSYSFNLMLITMLLNNSKVNVYERRWRNLLHEWARIPRSVEDIKNAIIQDDSFNPGVKYIEQALYEIKREAESSPLGDKLKEYWDSAIQNWGKEKENNTIKWCFIRSYILVLIVRELQGVSSDADFKLKADRIKDLSKIIPLLSGDEINDIEQRKELDKLSALLIESMCKHIVKKYSSKQAQYAAFKNLGFNLTYHDTAEINVFKPIVLSVLFVLVINTVATWVSIEQRNDNRYIRGIPTQVLLENIMLKDLKKDFLTYGEKIKLEREIDTRPESVKLYEILTERVKKKIRAKPVPGIPPSAEEVTMSLMLPGVFFDNYPDHVLKPFKVNREIVSGLIKRSENAEHGVPRLLTLSTVKEQIPKAKADTLKRWALGGFVSLMIAMFVGLMIQKVTTYGGMEANIMIYAVTLIVSTVGALIYFNWGSTSPNSLGRFMLALSYSTVSIIVFMSLEDISHEYREVLEKTLIHAIGLGVVLAILQVLTRLSFSSTGALWTLDNLYLGLVGFARGFFLGGVITYLIQDSLRLQQLSSFRQVPRARFNNIMTLILDGEERRVDSRNISKNGALVKCGCDLKPGDHVVVSTPFFGEVKGTIKWTKKRQVRKQLTGIEFMGARQKLRNFIRLQFGEFYA